MPDRMTSALYSLHLVLVELRSMSFAGHDPREIAEVLDWAEAMPFLIAKTGEDRTEAFRNHLRAIAEKSPRFERVLTAFDANRGFHG
jgi:hypothetical protein